MGDPSKKVQQMLNSKVDFQQLKKPGSYLNLHEKVATELALEIEADRNPDYISISWEAQVEAQDYFNKHGFIKTLNRMIDMRKKRGVFDETEEDSGLMEAHHNEN